MYRYNVNPLQIQDRETFYKVLNLDKKLAERIVVKFNKTFYFVHAKIAEA
jgi:hypothetical protein